MEKYFDYTPASLLYNKVQTELSMNKESYANKKKISTKTIGVLVTIMIVMLVITILNIVGIVYEFKCNYTILGVASIIGLFFGIPIGMIFYIIYLVNPSICQK
jgi:hypothetical protein